MHETKLSAKKKTMKSANLPRGNFYLQQGQFSYPGILKTVRDLSENVNSEGKTDCFRNQVKSHLRRMGQFIPKNMTSIYIPYKDLDEVKGQFKLQERAEESIVSLPRTYDGACHCYCFCCYLS